MSDDRLDVNRLDPSRAMDLHIAEAWMDWEWTEGRHVDVSSVADPIWLLPPGTVVSEVPPGEWTYYDEGSQDNRLTIFDVPRFSRDMAAAWELAERMRSSGLTLRLTNARVDDPGIPADWYVYHFQPTSRIGQSGTGVAYDAPLAICRAAIDAL